MEAPKPSILRKTAIRAKGLRPEAAETLYDLAENASSLITGAILAVLVSLFCDDAFCSMLALYIFSQNGLFYRICYEILYYYSFDGYWSKCILYIPTLNYTIWPISGYSLGAIVIRVFGGIYWLFAALINLFLIFSALLTVLDQGIEQLLVGVPSDPLPFLGLLARLPWLSYVQRGRGLGVELWSLYRNSIYLLLRRISLLIILAGSTSPLNSSGLLRIILVAHEACLILNTSLVIYNDILHSDRLGS
jgi:hypothetical protein